MQHCALNVALYQPGNGHKLWALTERGAAAVQRGPDVLSIGPSSLAWDGSALEVRIDEVAVPIPRRIRGTLRLIPTSIERHRQALDPDAQHLWRPIAPCAWVEVRLEQPALSWAGPAYLDTNQGARPLDTDFRDWTWSRGRVSGGTMVSYTVMRRDAPPLSLALRYADAGGVAEVQPPAMVTLPPTRWRISRRAGSDPGAEPAVAATLEDTPFYARSIVATRLLGQPVTIMHESLSLDRFRAPWVQAMLPFRMPRRSW
jgi:carotenoid 1,2-hydratase